MPGKLIPHAALRKLCKATGLGQASFASMIGVPFRTLVAIMAGQRQLPERMAELIFVYTGARPHSLFDDEPLDANGRPYDAESFKDWNWQMMNQSSRVERETTAKAAAQLRRLQEVATGRQLVVIQYRFQRWFDETVRALKLRTAFKRDARKVDHLPVIKLGPGRIVRYGRTTAVGIIGAGPKKAQRRQKVTPE